MIGTAGTSPPPMPDTRGVSTVPDSQTALSFEDSDDHQDRNPRLSPENNWRGDAKLYRLDPPMEVRGWENAVTASTEYVVVSAAVVPFSGPETYIFASDQDGNVEDWCEQAGSYRGGLDHEAALEGAGYVVEAS